MPGKVGSAGTKIYVAGVHADATDTEAEYDALTWVEIGEVTNFGEFGAQFAEVTHKPVNTGVVERLKGSKDNGSLQLQLARVPGDAGQTILKTALESYSAYDFKVELNDKPTGAGAKPTRFFFPALVMSYPTNIGDADSVVQATVSLGIDGKIVDAAKVAGT